MKSFSRFFSLATKIETPWLKKKPVRMSYLLQFDGAANPNPGPASGAYVLFSPPLKDNGSICRFVVEEGYRFLPHATNNEAEYTGLILGLEAAKNHGVKQLEIEGDSTLVVNQVLGAWQVKTPNLVPLKSKAAALYFSFPTRLLRQIPRDLNADADSLSKEALQTKMEVHRKSGSLVI
jgi:ribonuclease HI